VLGMLFVLMPAFYYLAEVLRWRMTWLVTLGRTALVLYFIHQLIVLTLVSTGAMFLVAPFMPKVVRTIGKKNGYIGAGALAVIAGIGISASPPTMPAVAIVFFALMGIATAGVNILMFALEADTVEYGEWQTGVRTEGITYALFSFTRKLGQAVGGAMAAYGIGLGGYIAGAPTQSGDALDSIRYTAGFLPAAFILIAVAIMYFYPLTEARFTQLVAETAQRRAARAVAEAAES